MFTQLIRVEEKGNFSEKKYSTILDCAFVKNKTKCDCKVRVVKRTNVVRPFMGCIVSMKWKKIIMNIEKLN